MSCNRSLGGLGTHPKKRKARVDLDSVLDAATGTAAAAVAAGEGIGHAAAANVAVLPAGPLVR